MSEKSPEELLWKAQAAELLRKMMADPSTAYERKRGEVLVAMIRSVAYKEVGFAQHLSPEQYLVEKGFTLTEIKEHMPFARIVMTVLYLEHPEIFPAMYAARRQADG